MGDKEYKQRHREQGLCLYCSVLAVASGLCIDHFFTHKVAYTKHIESNREKFNARILAVHRGWKDEGRCWDCGAPLIPEETGVRCMNCADRNNLSKQGPIRGLNAITFKEAT